MNEFSKFTEIIKLKESGFDLKDFAKKFDIDKLLDGYLEELNMLFMYHGLSIKLGESIEHEDASDTNYENTTYTSASIDAEDDSYCIEEVVTSIVPQSELKAMIGSIVESISNDSVTNSFNKDFDTQVNEDYRLEDYLKINYLVNGWPYSVVREKASMIGIRGKIKQTVISIDSYYFAQ